MRTGQEQLSFLNMLLGIFCLGIWAAAVFVPPFSCLLALCLPLVLWCTLAIRRSSVWCWAGFGLLFLTLGALRFTAAFELPANDVSRFIGQEAELCGIVREAPHITADSRGTKVRYLIEAEQIRSGKRQERAGGFLYVHTRQRPGKPASLAEIGDRITVSGQLTVLHGYENPGRIDTVLSARSKGITARLLAGKSEVGIEKDSGFSWRRAVENIRRHCLQLMESVMPAEDAAAIFAMLFGGYEGIRPELTEAFTTTGIVHILSVSGSHITLLAVTLAFIGRKLRLKEKVMALLVVAAVTGYCMLAGGVPPAVRAGIMGVLVFFGQTAGREREGRRLLTLTGMAMLIISPLLFFDISFRLSFAATAGLLYLAPPIRKRLSRLPDFAATGLAVTIAAQLAVLPVLAWYFNSLSLSSLIANLVVVPVVELMIIIGLAAGAAGFLLPFMARLLFAADSLMLGAVYEAARFIAAMPLSTVYLPTPGAGTAAVYYLGLAYFLQTEERRETIKAALKPYGTWLAGAGLAVLFTLGGQRLLTAPEMEVHFIDVGQGDAALVITPHGRAFLIDTGGTLENSYDVGGRVVLPYLRHYGVTELDTLYLTHSHADHAAGAGSIVKKLPVKAVITAGEGRAAYAKTMGLSVADPLLNKMAAAVEGQTRELDGVKIEVLYAPRAASGENEDSNVIRVSYGRASFLFTGDLLTEREKALLAVADPKSTVLKVGHHGSKTSSSAEFLHEVGAGWAVISVGAGNTFGHPAKETVARITAAGAKVYRTDKDGAVVFRTDGENLRAETFTATKEAAFR